jgi:hypothetical protein
VPNAILLRHVRVGAGGGSQPIFQRGRAKDAVSSRAEGQELITEKRNTSEEGRNRVAEGNTRLLLLVRS